MKRRWMAALVVCALAGSARAERRHVVYVDALGKGGLWGLGYDVELASRFAVGTLASYYVLGGDRYATLAPYVAAYPLGRGRLRALVQLGPQLVRHVTPSPVPEWDGVASTRIGAALCAGVEYHRGVVVRAYGMIAAGAHVAPWLGLSIGWSR